MVLYKKSIAVPVVLLVPLFMMGNIHPHRSSLKGMNSGGHSVTVPIGGNTCGQLKGRKAAASPMEVS